MAETHRAGGRIGGDGARVGFGAGPGVCSRGVVCKERAGVQPPQLLSGVFSSSTSVSQITPAPSIARLSLMRSGRWPRFR